MLSELDRAQTYFTCRFFATLRVAATAINSLNAGWPLRIVVKRYLCRKINEIFIRCLSIYNCF